MVLFESTDVASITATVKEFGADAVTKSDIVSVINSFIEEDGYHSTEPFDVAVDCPKFYAAVWSMYGWGFERMLKCWTMFLIAMVLMARASDLTTFCPTVEDLVLPHDEDDWDSDGYPKWIDIGLRNWKWRSKKNKGKRYSMKAHRNYVDSKFCPVFWLLFWLSDSGINDVTIVEGACAWHEPLFDHDIVQRARVHAMQAWLLPWHAEGARVHAEIAVVHRRPLFQYHWHVRHC